MHFSSKCRTRSGALLLLVAVFMFCSYGEARAQFLIKWMAIGDMHMYYTEAGVPHSEDYRGHNLHWPGIRNEHGNVRGYATWLGATNFTDEEGKTWKHKVAHVGPRITGVGEVFPLEFSMKSQFEPPVTRVDGLESFLRPIAENDRQADPNLPAERGIETRVNSVLGITVERRVLAWSHEDHDDYHITEYTFTNTGNTDGDEEVELPDQTLEGVYFFFQNRYATNRSAGWVQDDAQGWGKWQMNDAVGDGHEDYDVDFRAQYSWLGHTLQTRGRQDIGNYATTVGGPVWNGHDWLLPRADSLGRLGANHFVGKIYLHADDKAYDASVARGQRVNASDIDHPDEDMQPSVWRMQWTGHETTHVNDHLSESGNQLEYQFMSGADLLADPANVGGNTREYPHQADRVLAPLVSDGPETTFSIADFANHSGDPTMGQGSDGWAFTESFGPYTMGPNQSVQLVIAEAVAGLNWEAEFEIGREYMLRAKGDDSVPIEYDANGDGVIDPETERLTKNLWVHTSRDSLLQMFERAKANFESGYTSVPSPPLPPRAFNVNSESGQITISWEPYGSPPKAWELWRAQNRYDGLAIDGGSASDETYATNRHVYRRIARVDGGKTSFADTEVTRGLSYFYYLQAVDDVGGRELKSSRYYAQTYQPASLKRAPGAALADARVVPNPFHLGASSDLHFSGAKNTLAFLDIPGRATIRIYSEIGELVKTIQHEDLSGDEFWDLQTESQQLVVSGLYIAAITDDETGDTVLKKFVIIR